MKLLLKIALVLIFYVSSSAAFAQPALNVQNRINSKVQTRVQGKVINSTTNKAAAISRKATNKAASKATQKVVVQSGTVVKTVSPKTKTKTDTEVSLKKNADAKEMNDLKSESMQPITNNKKDPKKKQ